MDDSDIYVIFIMLTFIGIILIVISSIAYDVLTKTDEEYCKNVITLLSKQNMAISDDRRCIDYLLNN